MLAKGENMKKTRELVLIALFVALAVVLDYVKELLPFLNMPNGGSINIALLPIVIGSFVLGYKKGIVIGLMWWLLTFIMGMNRWFISMPQYLLDYIIPSGIIGISSIFYHKRKVYEVILGIILAMIIRTASILVSGAIYWPGDAASGSVAAWAGSLSYNLPYSIATLLMLIVVSPVILKSIKKYLV